MKVQQLIVLTGLAIFLTSISLFTPENDAFAIEFSNYTSENYGIYFEYPTDWRVIEKTFRFDSGPDITITKLVTVIGILKTNNMAKYDLDLDEATEMSLKATTKDFTKEYRTIEEPSITTIGDQDVGTFLITEQDKYRDFPTKLAQQYWIVPQDNQEYTLIMFTSIAEDFDKPENIEIREHFINSIKFLNDSESQDEDDEDNEDEDEEEEEEDGSRFD